MHLESIKNYRTEQIKNNLTTSDTFKIKVTNSNSGTKWLNISAEELAAIATLLNVTEA
jgi:hypothetical protein